MASKTAGREIKDPFIIVDPRTGARYYGGDQAWFERGSQNFAGCGVVASANALRALLCKYPGAYKQAEGKLKLLGNVVLTRDEYTSVIKELYSKMLVAELPVVSQIYDRRKMPYGSKLLKVIPPSFGMSASSVVRGVLKYARKHGVLLHDAYLPALYTDYDRGLDFIRKGLFESGAVILMTSFNKHSLTLYRGKAGETKDIAATSFMKSHFATITDILYDDGEPVIKLSTWGRVATIPYKQLHESWQKRRAYVSSLIYFIPERSKARYRADMRKSASFTPVAAIKTVAGPFSRIFGK
ncbi:MAG: hypothetical protein K5770_02595 [Lachnospiraceae bacterium]|nr:hypothetical protein [Lachnospiraceae bacterium]